MKSITDTLLVSIDLATDDECFIQMTEKQTILY